MAIIVNIFKQLSKVSKITLIFMHKAALNLVAQRGLAETKANGVCAVIFRL